MALKRNPITEAYEIDIEYQREDWGANFHVPEAKEQMSSLTFDKANSFGFKITSPCTFNYSWKEEPKFTTHDFDPWEMDYLIHDDGISFYTGLAIKLPPRTCFLVQALFDEGRDYVLDNGDGKSFENIRLYLKKQIYKDVVYIQKDQPILRILPIPDMAYSYQYRRRAIGQSGDNNGKR